MVWWLRWAPEVLVGLVVVVALYWLVEAVASAVGSD